MVLGDSKRFHRAESQGSVKASERNLPIRIHGGFQSCKRRLNAGLTDNVLEICNCLDLFTSFNHLGSTDTSTPVA